MERKEREARKRRGEKVKGVLLEDAARDDFGRFTHTGQALDKCQKEEDLFKGGEWRGWKGWRDVGIAR